MGRAIVRSPVRKVHNSTWRVDTVDGNRLWVASAGTGSSSAWGNAVAVDVAGNSYVVGGFTGGANFSFVRGAPISFNSG